MNFIGRTQELGTLSSLYDKDSFQMCIVYGRRRVGKTTLLKKFCEGKKCVYFTAVRSSIEKNTEMFGNKVWVNHFSYGFSLKCFRLSPSCRHP